MKKVFLFFLCDDLIATFRLFRLANFNKLILGLLFLKEKKFRKILKRTKKKRWAFNYKGPSKLGSSVVTMIVTIDKHGTHLLLDTYKVLNIFKFRWRHHRREIKKNSIRAYCV
jgi:hypothetical protein